MELIDMTELQKVLQDLANDIRDNYKSALATSNRYTTERGLIDSVKTQVVVGDSEYEVTMTLNDYWKYVENDTRPQLPKEYWKENNIKPRFPPRSAIMRWIEIKPVIPYPGMNGRIPTKSQLTFLISRKIAECGTKGSHDLERAKENTIPWYRERIAEALGHDMTNYIRKVIAQKPIG